MLFSVKYRLWISLATEYGIEIYILTFRYILSYVFKNGTQWFDFSYI